MKTNLWLGVVAVSILALVGCAGTENDDANDDSSEEDVTGVKDFRALESELGLVKDVANKHGQWQRPDARVKSGTCYQRTVGKAPADFELRRYSSATAFFHKLTTKPDTETGDARPVVCMDVDARDISGKIGSAYVNRFELDMLMRYHLGRPGAEQGGAGTSYVDYERGALSIDDGQGLADAPTVPIVRGGRLASIRTKSGGEVDGVLARVVYAFAWRNAKANDVFTLGSDPVGTFVGATEKGDDLTVRYAHLDAHSTWKGRTQTITITSRNADTAVAAHALVTCTIQYRDSGQPRTSDCKGL